MSLLKPIWFPIVLCLCNPSFAIDASSRGTHFKAYEHLSASHGTAAGISASPDGRFVAMAWEAADSSVKLEIVDRVDREIVQQLPGAFGPLWSPDGKSLAFYRYTTRKQDARSDVQLWVLKGPKGHARRLTSLDGGVRPDPWTRVAGTSYDAYSISWSPDSNEIVFASKVCTADCARAESVTDTQAPIVFGNNSSADELVSRVVPASPKTTSGVTGAALRDLQATGQNQLFVVDVRTLHVRRLTQGIRTWFHPQWHPDGQRIAGAVLNGNFSWDSSTSQIALIDAKTGAWSQITAGIGLKYRPQWSPDGRALAYLQSDSTFTQARTVVRADWASGPESRSDLDRHVIRFQWAPGGSSIFVLFRDGPSSRLAEIGQDGHFRKDVSQTGEWAPTSVLEFSSSSDLIVWFEVDPNRGISLREARQGQSKPSSLVDIVRFAWNSTARIFKWRSAKGEQFEGSLLVPGSTGNSTHLPMVIDAYPAKAGSDWSSPLEGNYAMADNGFVVFRPGVSAPNAWWNSYTTSQFSADGIGVEGWLRLRDAIVSGIDALSNSGLIDKNRICLIGLSNGGGVAASLVTEMPFRCAIIVSPVGTDFLRPPLLEETWGTTSVLLGRPPGDNPWETLFRLSPVFRMGNVHSEILLAVGGSGSTDLFNSVEMYRVLRYYNKNVSLVLYPNEGHIFEGAARYDFFQRSLAFLDGSLSSQAH